MAMLKRIGLLLLLGAVVGDVIATLIAPGVLNWYNSPGAGSALCNCAEIGRSATNQLIRAQSIGAAVGAVLFVVLGLIITRARAKSHHGDASTPLAPPPASKTPPSSTTP